MLKKFFTICFVLALALALTTGCPVKQTPSTPNEFTPTESTQTEENTATESANPTTSPAVPIVGGLTTEDNSETNE
ncbi:MAG: hypothetical protein LBT05_09125 [Planctomycetaceae bacterium]|nr:hypothetical protein [Planctomycetaceae bacterium]